ncbi:hypothetical protein Hanom_Chr12g01118571 [Helianthus anomalus]
MASDSSAIHFFKLQMCNTLWIPLSSSGRFNLYATIPTHSMISNCPIYLGLSLPFLLKRITPFQGDTLSSTLSPTSSFIGLRLLSA